MPAPFTLSRSAVRYCIDSNERDLAAADRAKVTFLLEAERLVAFAKARYFVPEECVTEFNGGIHDALVALFHRVESEIESDVEADRHLIGAED